MNSDAPPHPRAAHGFLDHVMLLAARDEDPQVSWRLRRALQGAAVPSRESLIEHAWNAGLGGDGMRLLLATADHVWRSAPADALERGQQSGRCTV